MNKLLMIPYKKTDDGITAIRLVISEEDFDKLLIEFPDIQCSVESSDEIPDAKIEFDYELQSYKIVLILSALKEKQDVIRS